MTRKNISFLSGQRVADLHSTINLAYEMSGYDEDTLFTFKVKDANSDTVVFASPTRVEKGQHILYLDINKPLRAGEYIVDIYVGKTKVFSDPINVRFVDVADFITKVIDNTDLDVTEYPVGSLFFLYGDDEYLYLDSSKRLTSLGKASSLNPSLEGLSHEEVQEMIRQVLSGQSYATVEEVRNMLASQPTGSLLSPEQLLKIGNAITEIPEEYVTDTKLREIETNVGIMLVAMSKFDAFMLHNANQMKTNPDIFWKRVISEAKSNPDFAIATDKNIEFIVTETLDFRGLHVRLPHTKFLLNAKRGIGEELPSIILGNRSNIGHGPYQEIGVAVRRDTSLTKTQEAIVAQDSPTIQIEGAKGQTIKIGQTEHVRLKVWEGEPNSSSIGYNSIHITLANRLDFAVEGEGGKAWINENTFYLNRIIGLVIDGTTYHHNNNLFIGGTFEGAGAVIDIRKGTRNRFIHTRMESLGTLKFGQGTSFNTIERAYFGSIQTLGKIATTFEDLGSFNQVKTPIESLLYCQKVYSLASAEPIRTDQTWTDIAQSKVFEMVGGEDYLVFELDNPESQYLVYIEKHTMTGYRTSIQELNYTAGWLTKQEDSSKSINRIKGNLTGGKKYGEVTFMINDPGTHYISVTIASTGSLDKQQSNRFSVDMYSSRPRMILTEVSPYRAD